jgi:hypothetical protein
MNFNGEATFLLTSGVTINERACGKNYVMRPPPSLYVYIYLFIILYMKG